VVAKSTGGTGGESEGAGASEISSRWSFAHLGNCIVSRAAADASDMASRIGQNTHCANFFVASARIKRLLEELIYLRSLYQRLL
jgi:hypothetical protein